MGLMAHLFVAHASVRFRTVGLSCQEDGDSRRHQRRSTQARQGVVTVAGRGQGPEECRAHWRRSDG